MGHVDPELLLPGPPSLQHGLLPHIGCCLQVTGTFVDPLKTVMPELYDDVPSPI